jgi:Flp pilus assembly protein TadD
LNCREYPLKNTLLIVTLPLVLSACASVGQQAQTSQQPQTSTQAAGSAPPSVITAESGPIRTQTVAQRAGATSGEPKEDNLPKVELTEELLYKLLASEFAFQRGDWQSAYVTDMAAAQQTRDPRLAKRAAEIALSAKQADEALDAVRLWRNLAPNSDEAAQYYLSFVVLSDNLAEAKPILEQRLKEARPQTRGLLAFQMQRLLSRAKDKAAAFTLLEEVLAPYLDMTESHLALAQGAFAAGDNERARREAQLALKAKPDSEIAVLALAQVTPDKAEANRIISSFIAKNPKAREVRLAYARNLVEEKQFAAARAQFEALLKEQPQDLTSLYALGVLEVQANDLPAAEKHLTSYLNVLAANPDDERDPSQALLLLAQIAEDRKDTDGALKWLSQIEPGENYLSAQVKRAQIIAKRGDIVGARKALHDMALNGEREESQMLLAEAQLLRDANRLPESLEVLKAGLKKFPENTDLLYDYAMVAEKSNQYEVMEASLRKIMQLAPSNHHAYNALGYSLAERNIRLDEAFILIDKALKLAPDDPFIMDSMGWIQFRLGRLKDAEASLRRAYELRPDVEIAAHLGEVLWVKGQKADAQKLWRDAQTKDPQNDTLKSTLARLNVNL